MAGGEVDIKPGDQGVYEIVAAAVKCEWGSKGEIGGCASVEVEC